VTLVPPGPSKGSASPVTVPAASSASDVDAALRGPILVVDDDIDIREIVSEVLTDVGYSVATARNGFEALELLKKLRPSLILLDLNMPLMDGIEFRHRQKEDPVLLRIPTVVMSAMDQMQGRIAELGVEAALTKPMELRSLLEVVERFIARTP
jgi:CheY-like chemotaxis protein